MVRWQRGYCGKRERERERKGGRVAFLPSCADLAITTIEAPPPTTIGLICEKEGLSL
jgi:hypothetical protein